MLRVDEVCKHSHMFSNPSIQPGHECYHCDGKSLLWSVFAIINILYASNGRAHV